MNAFEINASIAAIANLLAASLTNRELAYWGTILAQLGESMGMLAALAEFDKDAPSELLTGAAGEGKEDSGNAGDAAVIAGLI